MPRDHQRLNEIASRILKYVDGNYKNLGMVLCVFDSRGEAARPTAIVLHGINEEEAIRMMRQNADTIEAAVKGGDTDSPLILAPTLVKPVLG